MGKRPSKAWAGDVKISLKFKPEKGSDRMNIFEQVWQTSSKIQEGLNATKNDQQHLYGAIEQMRFSIRQKRYGLLSENKKP